MDLGTTFRTALILAKEKIYQGQKEKSGVAKKEIATNRTLWITNLSMIPFFAMLSFFVAGAQIATGCLSARSLYFYWHSFFYLSS
ncbi:hypothetical protein AKJ40_03040 [candidate division MSBL1 archaeon SCGC-AAA259M10]|uniref:Uncharacterized protein n=1 Tax=candidate division MSBL1 archaeon SCGC-AAA259M10 TaxID=1698270 RepID=A0A133UZ80_9EURY|nr:hypothetical protein AKJ40_03040 [candidate division MSBL1 archaeon SCGC-AAA259M10]